MDNKVIFGIIGASLTLLGFLLREIWDSYKSRHSKVEQKLDHLREDLSELKTILLMTQTKYDLMHKEQEKTLNTFYERLRTLEQQRPEF